MKLKKKLQTRGGQCFLTCHLYQEPVISGWGLSIELVATHTHTHTRLSPGLDLAVRPNIAHLDIQQSEKDPK